MAGQDEVAIISVRTFAALAAVLGLAMATPVESSEPAGAGEPGAALLSLLNPGGSTRVATVRSGGEPGGGDLVDTLAVPALDTVTLEVLVPAEPTEFNVTCSGCHSVVFAVAAGQRIIVILAGDGDPPPFRSDLVVANESAVRHVGALRTGARSGTGRALLRFDLAPGEAVSVGLRLPADRLLDLNLACPACAPQAARIGNGIDLEMVIR